MSFFNNRRNRTEKEASIEGVDSNNDIDWNGNSTTEYNRLFDNDSSVLGAEESPSLFQSSNNSNKKSKRLIFTSNNNKDKRESETFFAFGLMLRREYKSSSEYGNSTPSVSKVHTGGQIIRYINKQEKDAIQTLDIAAHGSQFGIWFQNENNIFGNVDDLVIEGTVLPKNGLYINRDYQYKDSAGYGPGLWPNGAASLDDIDYSRFSNNAKVEISGCATAGTVKWGTNIRIDEKYNFALIFSLLLHWAGKKKSVVIGHFGGAGPDAKNDYRQGERVVYHRGSKLFSTFEKGNIPRLKIENAINKFNREFDED